MLFSRTGVSRVLPSYKGLNWELEALGKSFRQGVKATFAVVLPSLVTLRTLPFSMHNSHVYEEHQTSNGNKRSSPSSYTSNFGHNFHYWCKPQSMWCKSFKQRAGAQNLRGRSEAARARYVLPRCR